MLKMTLVYFTRSHVKLHIFSTHLLSSSITTQFLPSVSRESKLLDTNQFMQRFIFSFLLCLNKYVRALRVNWPLTQGWVLWYRFDFQNYWLVLTIKKNTREKESPARHLNKVLWGQSYKYEGKTGVSNTRLMGQ